MKKTIKVKTDEECEYYSDFSGKRFEHDIPEVVLNLEFGYGSPFDDSKCEFHLTHDESVEILQLIKNKISNKTKKVLTESLKKSEKQYESSIKSRDWNSCDFLASEIDMFKFLLTI